MAKILIQFLARMFSKQDSSPNYISAHEDEDWCVAIVVKLLGDFSQPDFQTKILIHKKPSLLLAGTDGLNSKPYNFIASARPPR